MLEGGQGIVADDVVNHDVKKLNSSSRTIQGLKVATARSYQKAKYLTVSDLVKLAEEAGLESP